MKLPSLFKPSEPNLTWRWPSCSQPRTLSFRTNINATADIFPTVNSTYNLDDTTHTVGQTHDSSSFNSSDEKDNDDSESEQIETVDIRGLRSERLFFKPDKTSSIMEEGAKYMGQFPSKESTVVLTTMDSNDPYLDFRKLMEEMVEAKGVKDWKGLEELLSWYLRVNRKCNHEYVVGAFVDLLVGLSFAASFSCSCSCLRNSVSSPLSFYNTSSSSSSSSFGSSSTSFVSPVESEKIVSTLACMSSLSEDDQEELLGV